MIKWFLKLALISLMAVTPLVMLIRQSGVIIERQMRTHMSGGADIEMGENRELINYLAMNLAVAYTYSYFIGVALICIAIGKLFVEFYNEFIILKRMGDFIDTADCARVEPEIEECLSNAEIYECELKNSLKISNRRRGGLALDLNVGNNRYADVVNGYLHESNEGVENAN